MRISRRVGQLFCDWYDQILICHTDKLFMGPTFFFFFSHTFTFQLLDKPWSQVSSLSPSPVLDFNFYRAQSISYAVGFVSRKRLFRLKPQSRILTQSNKGFFDSTFFD